jgi:hypothetical protein
MWRHVGVNARNAVVAQSDVRLARASDGPRELDWPVRRSVVDLPREEHDEAAAREFFFGA